ncbi:CLIP domain-containing serine protease B15 [Culex quinquefasciatus]|nr:CLIP domain-containing serine protease B15 [Culex quinquefasciatus]
MKWLILRLLLQMLVAIVCVSGVLNETCTTTSLQVGRCVLPINCEYALKILRSTYISDEEWYYLHNNKCGTIREGRIPKPLICCPVVSNVPSCGVSVNNRIFGGEETAFGEIPWAGLIRYKVGKNRFAAKCGCTLLNSRWVLTAAHCITSVPSSWKLHRVVFSEWNANKRAPCNPEVTETKQCRKEYSIEEHIIHPMFESDSLSMRHDLAMIKTETEVEFDDYVKPICLPFSNRIQELPIDGELFTVTGWGQTELDNNSGIQRHVEVFGKNNSVCDKAFVPIGITLTEDQICVGGERGKDSCRGDSGGSLTRQDGLINYIVGIVSLGAQKCGTKDHPGVYTKVANYLDWIEEVMIA